MDHTLDKLWIGMCQSLPVLKDVSPVSFVIQYFGTIQFTRSIDGKSVPGPAWIPMSSAEF